MLVACIIAYRDNLSYVGELLVAYGWSAVYSIQNLEQLYVLV